MKSHHLQMYPGNTDKMQDEQNQRTQENGGSKEKDENDDEEGNDEGEEGRGANLEGTAGYTQEQECYCCV